MKNIASKGGYFNESIFVNHSIDPHYSNIYGSKSHLLTMDNCVVRELLKIQTSQRKRFEKFADKILVKKN